MNLVCQGIKNIMQWIQRCQHSRSYSFIMRFFPFPHISQLWIISLIHRWSEYVITWNEIPSNGNSGSQCGPCCTVVLTQIPILIPQFVIYQVWPKDNFVCDASNKTQDNGGRRIQSRSCFIIMGHSSMTWQILNIDG